LTGVNCPKCQTIVQADSNFCEECGTPLKVFSARVAQRKGLCECGAGPDKIGEDGYCEVCGLKVANSAGDHVEIELSPLAAGVSDLGKRHWQNEDSFCVHRENETLIAIVCDGVSVSQNPDQASRCAAGAAKDSLAESAVKSNPDFREEMRDAIGRADGAVKKVSFIPALEDIDPPSSTIVAVIVVPSAGSGKPKRAIIGWLGDTRAYYLTNKGNTLLTKDHSWANAIVEAGQMSYEEAIKDPRSHRLTRALGGYPEKAGAEMDEPGIIEVDLSATGWLILCTDGVWNYADSAENLARIFHAVPMTATALEIARFLTEWANTRGGKDNVSVVALAV
jgi:PPM family protein phosphatase